MKSLGLILIVLASCASTDPVGPVRFVNAPPVWKVNDRVDVAKAPDELPFLRAYYHFNSFYLRAKRGLTLERDRRAVGVNSFDEVPDSTWFTNRIGVRKVTPAEILRGPGSGEAPDQYLPWTIASAKEGGTAIGFVVTDTRGVKFILKFDQKHAPEIETGADVVVARLLWAAGYNVPEDHVVQFKRTDLTLAKDAYVKVDGKKQPIDDAYVDKQLSKIVVGKDGQIRGLASVFIAGKNLGGSPRLGVRKDDPNDLIPHQLRRDQRGQAALFTWLSHTDTKEDNTYDAFQKDPKHPDVEYVVHYLIDFGKALGAMRSIDRTISAGYSYRFDAGIIMGDLFGLGLKPRPWDGDRELPLKGIGIYQVEDYHPDRWKGGHIYWPLLDKDRFDAFWGAKLMMRLKPHHIAAIVEEAHYSDPRSAAYMTETLIRRQRITARYWFDQVTPLDGFTSQRNTDGTVDFCFTDLTVAYNLDTRSTKYTLDTYTRDAEFFGASRSLGQTPGGKVCTMQMPLSPDGYTIVRLRVRRGDVDMPAVDVHLGSDGKLIGLRRR